MGFTIILKISSKPWRNILQGGAGRIMRAEGRGKDRRYTHGNIFVNLIALNEQFLSYSQHKANNSTSFAT